MVRLKAFNLTLPQYITMRAIDSYGRPCTMSEIAETAMQVSATITSIIDRLEERGLVEVTLNPEDRRSFNANLTEQGQLLLAEIDQQKQSRLSPEFRQQMLVMMQGYLAALTSDLDEQ